MGRPLWCGFGMRHIAFDCERPGLRGWLISSCGVQSMRGVCCPLSQFSWLLRWVALRFWSAVRDYFRPRTDPVFVWHLTPAITASCCVHWKNHLEPARMNPGI